MSPGCRVKCGEKCGESPRNLYTRTHLERVQQHALRIAQESSCRGAVTVISRESPHPALYTLPRTFAPHRIPCTLDFQTFPASRTPHFTRHPPSMLYTLYMLATPVAVCIGTPRRYTRLAWLANPNSNPTNPCDY